MMLNLAGHDHPPYARLAEDFKGAVDLSQFECVDFIGDVGEGFLGASRESDRDDAVALPCRLFGE